MIDEIEQSLAHCLISDRHGIRQTLKKLSAHSASEKELSKLLSRVQRSQSIVGQRQQPVTLNYPESLPVSERREDILKLIREHQVVVIAGETGSGKTTQLPKLCLEAGLGIYGRIGHTQPRRLAARSVANRIADELGSQLGTTVGYQVRFSDQSSDASRIKVMTDGILLAQTQNDRYLNEYDCIIIDEAHERSLNIDFLLGYLKQLLAKRPDLKLIITSATIDVERFSKHFDNAPVVEVSGRTYPVEVRYRGLVRNDTDEDDRTLFEGIRDALAELREEDKKRGRSGDVLIFLPGERDIRECAEYLRKESLPATDILPLYARLSGADQQRIFSPHGGRRIVLSTNVAETSLTVPGIRYVIDSGIARISRYSYRSKVQRLPLEAISQASANQRSGRCGRMEPGVCIRLYEESDFNKRSEFTEPEIQRTNLATVILQMLSLRLGNIQQFPFVDPPDERFVKDGFLRLQELQAVNDKRHLTEHGKRMARLPLDPGTAAMLLAAKTYHCISDVLIIASALTVADPRERPADKQQASAEKHRQWAHEESDFVSLINLWNGHEQQRQELTQNQLRKWCKSNFLSYLRLREWRDVHRQLTLSCRDLGLISKEGKGVDKSALGNQSRDIQAQDNQPQNMPSQGTDYANLHKALLVGMPANVGFHQEQKEYAGARGRRFVQAPGTAGYKKPYKWIVAGELVETQKLYARMVAKIEPEWIEETASHLLRFQYFEPHFSPRRGQVLAYEQSTLYGLVVNPRKSVNYANTHPEEAHEILLMDGIVAAKMKSNVPFYVHNLALLKDVTEYEEKSRRRDLVIEDHALLTFYQTHLPSHITSVRDLESWFKKAPETEKEAVHFTREFLLSDAAQGVTDNDYPSELDINGLRFPLSYAFAPNSPDDGVSITVPVAMLSQVDRTLTEWLVPGLIINKVIALIKGLPKQSRKQFVPVPNTASDFLKKYHVRQGGLLQLLTEYLNRSLIEKISVDSWQNIELEPHLLMNVKVVDDQGNLLAQGRDLHKLQQTFSEQGRVATLDMSDARYQRSGIVRWDLGSLPVTTETKIAGLPVRAYPVLMAEGDSVSLSLETAEGKAEQVHRFGVLRLLILSHKHQEHELKKLIHTKLKGHWLKSKGLGSEQEQTKQLLEATFTHVMLPVNETLPRSEEEFQQRSDRRGELYGFAENLLNEYIEWLSIRHDILKSLRGAVSLDKAMAFSDIKVHLERLFEPSFMINMSWQRLSCYRRYLRAIAYRLDKLQGNLPRDRQSMIEFESLYEPWRQAVKNEEGRQDQERHAALNEFGWLLEEWRVALFAQPLGTRESVSIKRLSKRWQEIVQANL